MDVIAFHKSKCLQKRSFTALFLWNKTQKISKSLWTYKNASLIQRHGRHQTPSSPPSPPPPSPQTQVIWISRVVKVDFGFGFVWHFFRDLVHFAQGFDAQNCHHYHYCGFGFGCCYWCYCLFCWFGRISVGSSWCWKWGQFSKILLILLYISNTWTKCL